MRISAGKKIGGGFFILLVLIAFISFEGILIMNQSSQDLNDVDVHMHRISLDYQIKNSFQGSALAMRGYMTYGDEKYLSQYREHMDLTKKLMADRVNNSSEKTRPEFEKLTERLSEYDRQIVQNMVPLLKEKKVKEAIAIGSLIAPITSEINKKLEERITENEKKNMGLIQEAKASSAEARQTTIIFSVIALIAGIVLAVWLTRGITGPVKIMVDGVNHLAQGDFTRDIKVSSKDEIGQLASTINQTREQLKGLVEEVVETAQNVAAHSQQLAASAEEVSGTVEEVANTAGQVASMAEQSLLNADSAAEESRKVVQVAYTGGEIVKDTINKINSISASVGKVNESIQNLGELSQKIGNITDVITSIADQTNLLALNAAIEAARAGDQGRGFAVVAEEVRKLAEQSANAAKEIGQLINKMQNGVGISIEAMKNSAEEVAIGVQFASETGKSLDNIVRAIEVNIGLVEGITRSAKQTSEGTQQLSAINELNKSTIQQVASATQELSVIASNLLASISRFKV